MKFDLGKFKLNNLKVRPLLNSKYKKYFVIFVFLRDGENPMITFRKYFVIFAFLKDGENLRITFRV